MKVQEISKSSYHGIAPGATFKLWITGDPNTYTATTRLICMNHLNGDRHWGQQDSHRNDGEDQSISFVIQAGAPCSIETRIVFLSDESSKITLHHHIEGDMDFDQDPSTWVLTGQLMEPQKLFTKKIDLYPSA